MRALSVRGAGGRVDGDGAGGTYLWRWRLEVVAADEEHVHPGGLGIVIELAGGARTPVEGSARGRSDGRRIGQDLLHPRIGVERLALHDPDGGERPHYLRIEGLCRLLLDDIVDHFEVAEVIGRNGVHHLACAFGELHRWLWLTR